MAEIPTFCSFFKLEPGRMAHVAVAISHPSTTGDRTPPVDAIADTPVAEARVNHSRWVASCPWGCADVEFVDPDDALFFCAECRNAPAGHALVRVLFPDQGERAAIEAALIERPRRATRNWEPGERAADLRAENRRRTRN